jgi:glutathione S-transferase
MLTLQDKAPDRSGSRLKLYDRNTSGNSYKVRLMLSFLELPCELIPVQLEEGRNKIDAAYFELNPRGQVPTLKDDDLVLWGSTAILMYLGARYDVTRQWLPAEPVALAQTGQWLELAQNEISTGLFLARAVRRFGYAGDLASAQMAGRRALEVLEGCLGRRDWLVGDRATIADVACFPYVALAGEGGFTLEDYPGVERWVARFKTLERFVCMPGISEAAPANSNHFDQATRA